MSQNRSLVQVDEIIQKIHLVRNLKVMLDSDLATAYGVSTKAFNQAIKRNADRFPKDFMFQLTLEEVEKMRSQIVTASRRNIRHRPFVFTEHGALMAANILNSPRAVAMSLYIVRAFIRLREESLTNAILEKRLAVIEKTLVSHDGALRDIILKIRPLLLPSPIPPKPRIGFHRDKF
jgi:hypothetical protein